MCLANKWSWQIGHTSSSVRGRCSWSWCFSASPYKTFNIYCSFDQIFAFTKISSGSPQKLARNFPIKKIYWVENWCGTQTIYLQLLHWTDFLMVILFSLVLSAIHLFHAAPSPAGKTLKNMIYQLLEIWCNFFSLTNSLTINTCESIVNHKVCTIYSYHSFIFTTTLSRDIHPILNTKE